MIWEKQRKGVGGGGKWTVPKRFRALMREDEHKS